MLFRRGLWEKAHTQTAIITWVFTRRTCAIEMNLADTTNIVIWDIPSPRCHGVPFLDFDLHSGFYRFARSDCRAQIECRENSDFIDRRRNPEVAVLKIECLLLASSRVSSILVFTCSHTKLISPLQTQTPKPCKPTTTTHKSPSSHKLPHLLPFLEASLPSATSDFLP